MHYTIRIGCKTTHTAAATIFVFDVEEQLVDDISNRRELIIH